jgi:hypothetical protein
VEEAGKFTGANTMGFPAPGQNMEMALVNLYVAEIVIGFPTPLPPEEGNTVLLLRQVDTGLQTMLSVKDFKVTLSWSDGSPIPALVNLVVRRPTVIAQEFGDTEQFCPCTMA